MAKSYYAVMRGDDLPLPCGDAAVLVADKHATQGDALTAFMHDNPEALKDYTSFTAHELGTRRKEAQDKFKVLGSWTTSAPTRSATSSAPS